MEHGLALMIIIAMVAYGHFEPVLKGRTMQSNLVPKQ